MEKKTKLTISGSATKSIKNIEIAKNKSKNSVVIEKQSNKFQVEGDHPGPLVLSQKLHHHIIEVCQINQRLLPKHHQ